MYSSSNDYDGNELTHIIRLFQMPLFILISGIFHKIPQNIHEAKGQVLKITKHIGIPLLFWAGITSCCFFVYNGCFNGCTINHLLNIVRSSVSIYWYFVCLLLCVYFSLFIEIVFKKLIYLWGGVLVLMLFPINIFNFQFLFFFFVLGVTLSKYRSELTILWERGTNIVKFGLFIALMVVSHYYPSCLTFYNFPNYVLGNYIELNIIGYNIGIPSYVVIFIRLFIYAFSTLFWLSFFCHIYIKFNTNRIILIIESIGKETLFLFTAHLFVLVNYRSITELLGYEQGIILNYPILRFYLCDVIISIVITLLLYKTVSVLNKYKATRLLALGRL